MKLSSTQHLKTAFFQTHGFFTEFKEHPAVAVSCVYNMYRFFSSNENLLSRRLVKVYNVLYSYIVHGDDRMK